VKGIVQTGLFIMEGIMHFNFDWWFGGNYDERIAEAKRRCAVNHFKAPGATGRIEESGPMFQTYVGQVEARTIIYLRDGFSYEIKELIKRQDTTLFTFECVASEEAYRVGAFVVSIPFDEIVRVEVFAVHSDEKPEEMTAIKGFAGGQPPQGKRPEDRPARPEAVETTGV
jgi:hypothetical protein